MHAIIHIQNEFKHSEMGPVRREMSSSQSAATLCGWEVGLKAGMVQSTSG